MQYFGFAPGRSGCPFRDAYRSGAIPTLVNLTVNDYITGKLVSSRVIKITVDVYAEIRKPPIADALTVQQSGQADKGCVNFYRRRDPLQRCLKVPPTSLPSLPLVPVSMAESI
jgi:hypothetical protein